MANDSAVVEVRVPHENVNDETVTIIAWKVADGDRVEADQPLAEVETSKATFDVRSPQAGIVRTAAPAGKDVPVGAVLCYVAETSQAIAEKLGIGDSGIGAPAERRETRIGPKALALIRQHGLDEALFAGRGLVTESDVLKHMGLAPKSSASFAPATIQQDFTPTVATDSHALPRSKRLEAKVLSWGHSHTLPSLVAVAVPRSLHLTEETYPGLLGSVSAAIISATASLLRKYIAFNAYHADGNMHSYKQVNVGYAIDAGQGLKVPVIRDADLKSLEQIAEEKQSFIFAYLENQLAPEQLSGATFTITDLSSMQVNFFQPLINQGQSAILGVGGVVGGSYNLMLAFDHQLADGRMAGEFLGELRDQMIAFESTLMSGRVAPDEPSCEYCYRSLTDLRKLRRHLLKTIADPSGREKLICSICVEGW